MNAAALIALLSAISYGAGDFLSGLASRRDPPERVVALTHPLACVAFALLAVLRHEPLPSSSDLGWGAAAGVLGLLGVLTFYRALALGPMGTVSVTSGALGALIPVAAGLLLGEQLSLGNGLGVLLVLAGIALFSVLPGQGGRGGLPLALLAGLGFGLFFVLLAQSEAVFWTLAMARLTSSAVVVPYTLRRYGLRPLGPRLIFASAPGDALGNLCYLLAAQAGRLSVAGLLTNLYPVITALLAAMVLRERLNRVQWLGVALAVIGVPLVTAR
ncbi:EamA family transporter [Deinococcus sonorensis]|uniref:EamA family transporter n=2 Tax=Deinococcus sonorensis TaxID=309891 RepID=A0AAU7UAP9_9DEIO